MRGDSWAQREHIGHKALTLPATDEAQHMVPEHRQGSLLSMVPEIALSKLGLAEAPNPNKRGNKPTGKIILLT